MIEIIAFIVLAGGLASIRDEQNKLKAEVMKLRHQLSELEIRSKKSNSKKKGKK